MYHFRALYAGCLLFVSSMGILPLCKAADISRKAGAEFAEHVVSFDREKGKRLLPLPWAQNVSRTFQPCGRVEIIEAKFRDFRKALRIRSGKVPSHVYISKNIPVKLGDVLKVDVVFRSPDGKSPALFGLYDEYQSMRCTPISRSWDARTASFEIKDPRTKSVRIFLQCPRNAVMDYSHIVYRKLRPEEISVCSSAGNLLLWKERTRGVNLAYGKKVQFSPVPNQHLTSKGNSDPYDLTDGRLYRESGMLHFRKEAVGWTRQYSKISFMIDLGSVKAVKKAVIRIAGGRLTRGLSFPKELTVWGSRDGKNFYRGQSLRKLGRREIYLSNFRDLYYLPEEDGNQSPTYVYPFELELNAHVRFVAFQMEAAALELYCDEAAVIQATSAEVKSPAFDQISRQTPRYIFHENILLRPRMDVMYVPEGEYYPNYLLLDCRKKKLGGKFTFTINMPASVQYHHANCYPSHFRILEKSEKKKGRVIYHFSSKLPVGGELMTLAKVYGFGPLFFKVDDSGKVPEKERYVLFETFCDGALEKSVKVPLAFLKMPKIAPLKRLNNSIWLTPRHIQAWKGFLSAFTRAGFTYLPLFPEFPGEVKALDKFLGGVDMKSLRSRLFLVMTARQDKNSDFYCRTGNKSIRSHCLAYRGAVYQKMLDQITEYVRKYPCDFLTFGVESWEPVYMNNSMNCSRCDALRKQKKMNWVQYFNWGQVDYLKAFRNAVVKGAVQAGRKAPKIGFYALTPGTGVFRYSCKEGPVEFLGGFSKMYPDYTDEAQMSYYGRSAADVHKHVRSAFKVLKDPALSNPWLSGGTGAYYGEPFYQQTRHHFLEAVLNGAGGVQIFNFRSFESPLDYFNFASAVSQIAPYEDLLMEGSLDFSFSGTNKQLLYTKRDWKGKSLILIGNYDSINEAQTTLALKGRVTDLTGKKSRHVNGRYQVRVPADGYVLLLQE